MLVIGALKELSPYISSVKSAGKSIGLVPTMGALHEGHFALIEASKRENDITVVSVFVNPLQFNNESDLANYPRSIDSDLDLLKNHDVDMTFIPDVSKFYATKPLVSIDFGGLAKKLEGKYRNGHFEGVGIVVSKLLHLIDPLRAYFGLKDLQQFLLIKQMVLDLSFPCEIVGVETVREKTGLALSSRNSRLSESGRKIAVCIHEGLKKMEVGILNDNPIVPLIEEVRKFYDNQEAFELEYLEVINPIDLDSIDNYHHLNELAICVAGYVEGIRLIDNLYLRLK